MVAAPDTSADEPCRCARGLPSYGELARRAEVVESPRLAQLAGQRLASEVHRAALRRMAHAYRNLCAAVRRAENKYEAAATLLGSERPFGQVRLLWQIFGLQDDGR